jgi:hypothetical protein
MDRHRIRLRKPWQREATVGGVVWRRRFGRPSGVGVGQTVCVCVEGMPSGGSVTLNGQCLGPLPAPHASARYDVTRRLLARNELGIRFEESRETTSTVAPPGEVCLEICSGE